MVAAEGRVKLSCVTAIAELGVQIDQKNKAQITLLSALRKTAEAVMNETAEVAKTKIQTDNATTEELGEMIEMTFDNTYPVILGVSKLVNYIIALEDVTNTYMNETDPAKLEEHQKSYAKARKRYESIQKRLKSRVRDPEARELYKTL